MIMAYLWFGSIAYFEDGAIGTILGLLLGLLFFFFIPFFLTILKVFDDMIDNIYFDFLILFEYALCIYTLFFTLNNEEFFLFFITAIYLYGFHTYNNFSLSHMREKYSQLFSKVHK